MRGRFDALVIGAGPAGSVAALLLARAGWSVALVERQRFPRRKVCGECLAASNLPLLDSLGVGSAYAACAGAELRQVALLHGEREVVAELPPAADARHRWGRALGREAFDTLLLDAARAAGAEVLQPCAVQALSGGPGDWRCELRPLDGGAGTSLHAPLAIDAHGSWEALRCGGQAARAASAAGDLFAFKANFGATPLREGVISVLALEGGYGGMVVGDGGTATLACCIRRDRLAALRLAAPGLRAGEAVQAWLTRGCGGVRHALAGARREGPWLASGPLAPGVRLRAGDPLFCIGNAAGEAHPILGEGMSMALQSAALLCSHLLGAAQAQRPGADRQAELQRQYAADWRRHFGPRLRLAAVFAHAAMRPASASLLMALAGIWPGLLTSGARWGGKVQRGTDPAQFEGLRRAGTRAGAA
jgi:2-polyprenyl-6-methoxyphenol hydroxylase-like FAD-dependent oxidoreductase